ncbi:MAG: hypothetical protein SFW64_08255 [Alphaproteobacteria bacterium]|nr:hypothetical protein [Alphaproteobacteria bacterium]
MNNRKQWRAAVVAGLLLAGLSGCDKITDTSRAVQSVTLHAFNDTKASWTEFFTYHPPLPAPFPQTRYCYQLQSDIVCYDSEQPQLTAKLIGYQDGENRSWIQPGGGALGVSGGGAVALQPSPVKSQANMAANTVYPLDTGPVFDNAASGIQVRDMPPAKSAPAQQGSAAKKPVKKK